MHSANKQKNVRDASVTRPHDSVRSATKSIGSGFAAMKFPAAITLALFLVSFAPRVQNHNTLTWSLWGAALFLLAWQAWLLLGDAESQGKRSFSLSLALRPQHYIQAMVQFSVYAYWGYYWQPVYDHALLIIAQLLFAYGFDMLLSWSRRRDYVIGFGPFPIIFSINLFLWFRDDWFYMQFLMVAMGFMGKEYVRWIRDGRRVHIFNPSAFALGLFSLVLIATNTTDLTWGQEIASTLTLAPNIYSFLFFIGLIVMYFFSITLVAGMAAVTLFGLSGLYGWFTGIPYFIDSEIPAAVFLGLHLLITDPSTSPRTSLGKMLFGLLYGLGVFGLYTLLGALGVPTFYDKLLCVPLLNLSVIAIDRAVKHVHSPAWQSVWPNKISLTKDLKPNMGHMAIWVVFFATMSFIGRTDSQHTGDSMPFWQQACSAELSQGCARLVQLQSTYCNDNSAWACNELAVHYRQGKIIEKNEQRATDLFAKSCELKFAAACQNLVDEQQAYRDNPHELDLRLLLREGGLNLMTATAAELRARACEHGWEYACNG